MERMLTGFLVDVKGNVAKVVEFEDKLQNLYDMLDCQIIDVAYRKIGGINVCIVCDDEGVLLDKKVSAVDGEFRVQLVGNLLVLSASADCDGNFVSLTDNEIDKVKNNLVSYIDETGIVPCLSNVEYLC